jgi:hypothetical protein
MAPPVLQPDLGWDAGNIFADLMLSLSNTIRLAGNITQVECDSEVNAMRRRHALPKNSGARVILRRLRLRVGIEDLSLYMHLSRSVH